MKIDARVDTLLDELHSGPPWTGTCLECGKKAVSFKASGDGGFELSCDGCEELYHEE